MRKEKRDFTRLALHARASMLIGDQNIEGDIENLSLKGAFVRSSLLLGLNNVVTLTIENTLACGVKAKVVRVTDHGVGLEFERTLLD
jgi:hypothetical protein